MAIYRKTLLLLRYVRYIFSYGDASFLKQKPVYLYIKVLVRELVALTGQISDSELQRAKTQLKSMLLMNLESRPVIFEDVAR